MFRNYILIGWRNIRKHPFYTLVNLVGLSAGLAFTLLIAVYVWSECKVNSTLKNVDRQFILQSKWKDPNQGIGLTTLGPLAKELKEQYPHLVANYYRWDGITSNISKGDKVFREGIQICDSTMLNMYGFELLHGNPATAFQGALSVILTEEKALKYFGRTDVLGETITIENFSGSKQAFLITAVLKKPYKNSITYLNDDNDNQFFINSRNIAFFGRNMNWDNPYIVGYIELQPGVSPEAISAPMQALIRQQALPTIAASLTPYLVSLNEYYLSADNGLLSKMLYVLSGIALFILIMAIINFVNLSISRSAARMREVGIRKVVGGVRQQLIYQFLVESVLLVTFATLMAVVIFVLTKDHFSNLLNKPLPALPDLPIYYTVYLFLLVILVGFVAGIYPAFVLSSLRSVDSLKGKLTGVKENILLRRSLVAFQFGTAVVVLVCAIIITQQVNYFFTRDLGFERDYIVTAQLPRDWSLEGVRKMERVRHEFARMPQVRNASFSFEVPDGNSSGMTSIYRQGTDSTAAVSSQLLVTDEYYARTFGIQMAAGEFYSAPGAFTDSSRIVINETQARALGWRDVKEAVGAKVKFVNSNGGPATIAGVVKDFHFGSLKQAIPPVTFVHAGVINIYRILSLKLKAGDVGNTIGELQRKWASQLPGTPFEYTFMDETLQRLYTTEMQLKKAAYTATVLALIIVLLGVLGLISLSIRKRTKEIGIRKVLGASVQGIIALFYREFLPVLLVAAVIACPLAYIVMHNWLNDYSYRVGLSPVPFMLAVGLLALAITLLILLQTLKAATANPAKSLKTE